MLERCQLEPLRPDQCQRQQPGTGTGSRPPPPTICTGTHPAQQIAPPVQTEGQSSSAPRAAALAFFFCLAFQPARPAGSAARHALGVVGGRPGEKLESTRGALDTVHGYCAHHLHREGSAPPAPHPMTTPAADRHRRRPDDPAAHQLHRLPIACTPAPPDLTAAASAHRLHPSAAAHPAALPPACRSRSAPPTTAKRPKTSPPRPAAGGVRFST